jgi:hypothetical protein
VDNSSAPNGLALRLNIWRGLGPRVTSGAVQAVESGPIGFKAGREESRRSLKALCPQEPSRTRVWTTRSQVDPRRAIGIPSSSAPMTNSADVTSPPEARYWVAKFSTC